ncbi:MAG: DUF935 domain-containing protein [Dysgonamonadaceae bacterium]|jgi:hypothetical protein|nr:DUF935 domain-containing protein [Dysgonamonadaceae bacterium]
MKVHTTEKLDPQLFESIFRTNKKTIQEYVWEIERYCRFKSVQHQVVDGAVLDDRGKLIDLYEACLQQDAHLSAVLETLISQIVGERYMLARQNDKGKYVKDVEETRKIQGTQFVKIIRGIVEAKLFGYTLLEIFPTTDGRTGRLKEVNIVERRNVLPDQRRAILRQSMWSPGWDLDSSQYRDNYILINSGTLGLFSATTPLVLAKKFTMANYVNFSHTYGQPIIHGKTDSESNSDRKKLANEIASAAQNKVIITGLTDEIDIKTFTMSNSEKIYTGLIDTVNAEVSNLILGSESMAGATQSYVGSTNAHQDIFRDRVDVYREDIENVMNEEIIPRLVKMHYLKPGLDFKYSNRLEMSNKDKINLYTFLTDRYVIGADEIEKEFGVTVGAQLNLEVDLDGSVEPELIFEDGEEEEGGRKRKRKRNRRRIMSDEEYYKRYGAHRTVNFLRERK